MRSLDIAHSLFHATGVIGLALCLSGLAVFAPATRAQDLDLGGWQVLQSASAQTYTVPGGTVVSPADYVIIAREATQTAFEAFYGVSLGSNVTYLNSAGTMPLINGDEVYELRNPGAGLEDGPTPAIVATQMAHHRDDPEAAPWTSIDSTPTPGGGVEPQDGTFSGLVISEVNDAAGAGNFIYEFVELYYDGGSGGNLTPVVSGTEHSPTDPMDGGDLMITTTATDPDGNLDVVTCYWRYTGGVFAPLGMVAGAGDSYECTITNLEGNQALEYYILAVDTEDAQATDPVGAPTAYYSVYVQGDLPGGRVILFDHAHAQDAGTDGNWRIDDDFPSPLPANPGSESDWSGQLSTWAYELYLAGHTLRSNTTPLAPALLVDVDMLVIVEPQNPFTTDEIAAVGDYVFTGGSLFVVANHNGSDRNNNGWDSPSILGGYSVPHIQDPVGTDIETFCGALFGLHFHVKDEGNNSITGTFSNVDTSPANPIINGPAGSVNAVIYHVGNVMSLWPLANEHLTDVAGHIWKDGDTGNPDVNIAAWSRYGSGKVLGYGDSSSCADGTGSEPHANNWTEPGSNNREFFLNASFWLLAGSPVGVADEAPAPLGLALRAWPNPFNPVTTIEFLLPVAGWAEVSVRDLRGQLVRTLLAEERGAGTQTVTWNGLNDAGHAVASGIYLVRAAGPGSVSYAKVVLAK